MKHVPSLARRGLLALALTMFCAGCTGASEVAPSDPQNPHEQSSPADSAVTPQSQRMLTLDEVVIKAKKFAAQNKSPLKDPMTEDLTSVGQRLISGFQQSPPKQLRISDGAVVVWGWQEGQAEYQSLAIFDNQGELRMTGVATGVPVIYSPQSGTAVTSLKNYESFLKERSTYMPPPEVHLYAANQRDADIFYPLAARWLQAAMMGFNARCNDSSQAASCQVATEARVPIFLHTYECNSKASNPPECRLSAPDSFTDAATDIDAFKQ